MQRRNRKGQFTSGRIARRPNARRGMTKATARELGYDKGFYIATQAEFSAGMSRDHMASEAFDIESNSRQYADDPTYEIARHDDDFGTLFDAFDAGVSAGIKAGLRQRFAKKRKAKRVNPRGRRLAMAHAARYRSR